MFNACSFGGHDLKVSMAKPKQQYIAARTIVEPQTFDRSKEINDQFACEHANLPTYEAGL
jgi:hypothetical protein